MYQAVLFDLDGTLLGMDEDKFTKAYVTLLAGKAAERGYDPSILASGLFLALESMVKNDGSSLNRDVFWKTFSSAVNRDAIKDEPFFIEFYKNEFNGARSSCEFLEGAGKVVRRLKREGVELILATNPIFPEVATRARISWAGLNPDDFSLVTTYDNSCHSKPNLEYYNDIIKKRSLDAKKCLMVGNNTDEDMCAGRLGMDVFLMTRYLINKSGMDIGVFHRGDFEELEAFLDGKSTKLSTPYVPS